MHKKELIKRCRVEPGDKVKLKNHNTAWPFADKADKEKIKDNAQQLLEDSLGNLAEVQDVLYADNRHSLLVLFQAMDAAGKDSTIKHVMSGVNPQGCQVFSFKHPSAEEVDHNFLWRYMRCLPERGRIGIFNRSYYEDVLVVRVHPEILDGQQLPIKKRGKSLWNERFDDINAFERHLTRNGTHILKFFLHVSKDEQKKRFLERLDDPDKNWKFSMTDLQERHYWDAYMEAYEDALTHTSKEWAPWYIIPADHKWMSRTLVAEIIVSTLKKLNLRYPEVSDAQRVVIENARQLLEGED